MAYPESVLELLQTIQTKNKSAIEKGVQLLVETLENEGILFVFGSGHSSIVTQEAFHRAGGLIPVHPILHEFLTPLMTPKISGKIERLEGIADVLFARAQVTARDLMIIVSQSGINSAAIEMALAAKKAKVKTIAFTSVQHSMSVKSRHSSGKKLFELCDDVFDNQCPSGDAIETIAGTSVGATSTIANVFMYQWLLTETCRTLAQDGKKLPVYKSANLPGGDAHNESLEAIYKSRIPQI